MDLLYFQNPPGLQLLHCLRNTCEGGASIFSDSFYAAEQLRKKYPWLFSTLCKFPVTFHYKNAGEHYHYIRPVIEFDWDVNRTSVVNWSPPFQGPLDIDIGEPRHVTSKLTLYFDAIREFGRLIADEQNLYEYKMKEGECAIFNNRRALHARRAFDVGTGERWLKGAYVDTDPFESRLRVLLEEYWQDRKAEPGALEEDI